MRVLLTVGVGLVITLTWLLETGWLRAQEFAVPNYRHYLGYKRRHSTRAVSRSGAVALSVAEILRRSTNPLPVSAQLLAVTTSRP